MSFPKPVRISLSLGAALLLILTACTGPTATEETVVQPEASTTAPSDPTEETALTTEMAAPEETAAPTGTRPDDGEFSVAITWAYRDEQRLGVEIAVDNYPVPEGYQLGCPFTQVDLAVSPEDTRLLFQNETQVSLDDYYALVPQSRWYCQQLDESPGTVDYLLSLTHTYAPAAAPAWNEPPALNVALGEVTAYQMGEEMVLPGQGTFEFTMAFEPAGQTLTWRPETVFEADALTVELNRVSVNRSIAVLEACVTLDDHHSWQPEAAILHQEQELLATEYVLTEPLNAPDRDTVLENTHRCFSFLFVSDFPLDSMGAFQIGITQVVVDNTDPGTVTQADCEAVKVQVEAEHPGLEIRCYETEIRGQQQHWFEVLARPEGITQEEAYGWVEAAFRRTLPGPWLVDLQTTAVE